MDWSQLLFAAALAVACYAGRGDWRIVGCMVANFLATVTLAAWPLAVACADLACVVVLVMGSIRARVVAAFFVVMAAIYPIASAMGLGNAATYTIVDVLAFLQLMAVGHGDDGIGFVRRHLDRLRHRRGFSVVGGAKAAPSLVMASSQDRRGPG